MESRRIRVLCVEDSFDLAMAYKMLLSHDPRFEDVGARPSADGIVEEVLRSKPDVVLMDLTMPGLPPLQAIRLLAEHAPWCRVIAYSGYDDPEIRLASLRAGAWTFMTKGRDPSEVLDEIQRVATLPAEAKATVVAMVTPKMTGTPTRT